MTGPEREPRANSDLLRPRRVLVAAVAAAAGVLVALVLSPASRGAAPGPHPSTREAHQALRAQLACADCHSAHAGAPSVTALAGTVARVPMSACARCHDPARPDDPARACAGSGAWTGFSVCFDEHQRPDAPLPTAEACAREHGPARFVAWEQARGAAVTMPVQPARHVSWGGLGAGGAAAALALLGGALARRSRRRARPATLAPVPHERVRLPRIDATTCLGCQACVDACPFDALAVDRHVAVLSRPDACCGAGVCEQACPNGSLRIVERDEPVAGRPHVDAHLESLDRPGVFVAGDVTGIPLIRSAIAQGAAVAERVAATVPKGERGGRVDLAVVGSGPAGLSAALRARELGLSCVVLEQGDLAASIRAFPRGKLVLDAPMALPVEGPLWFRESTREELVAHWTRVVRTHRVDVRPRHRVTAVDAEPGGFVVSAHTPQGSQRVHAARVLLATGRRGSPRSLDVPVADAARGQVLTALSDASAWTGKRLLVVGLGDSAMEAVVALARQHGTVVTVAHRGRGFGRGSGRNIDAVRRLADAGRVRLLFATTVERVDVGEVTLRGPGGPERLRVDAVLSLLGGEPSRALLAAAGVRLSATQKG
jgi:thioredoxin reductase/NAD-dependent dihydropyrimidine dehydrogenase PreA subunit